MEVILSYRKQWGLNTCIYGPGRRVIKLEGGGGELSSMPVERVFGWSRKLIY